ncbi:hypothetical protein GCM10007416_17130 [Kroppenstedtia guangzhouensis]|uniref:Uncharacterized protein n=1 Tax=Kroppenstedtia guangzhouensis TaxID=1274356 RepID=A0ABQ1GIT5_9BACL|nr:hypothetical protein GCM10007416_17130 [Kroppenstedtia guangzhouensis]
MKTVHKFSNVNINGNVIDIEIRYIYVIYALYINNRIKKVYLCEKCYELDNRIKKCRFHFSINKHSCSIILTIYNESYLPYEEIPKIGDCPTRRRFS